MKNVLYILLALFVMSVLIYLSVPRDTVPHALIDVDTTTVLLKDEGGGIDNYEGTTPTISSKLVAPPDQFKTEKFKGKTFTHCLEIVAAWPDGEIYDLGDGLGGLTFMDFRVNGKHHLLTFSRDICETDEIIKDK